MGFRPSSAALYVATSFSRAFTRFCERMNLPEARKKGHIDYKLRRRLLLLLPLLLEYYYLRHWPLTLLSTSTCHSQLTSVNATAGARARAGASQLLKKMSQVILEASHSATLQGCHCEASWQLASARLDA